MTPSLLVHAEFFAEDGSELILPFGGLQGRGAMKQDPPIVRDLYLSLEDLFYGCTKKIKISRRVGAVGVKEGGMLGRVRNLGLGSPTLCRMFWQQNLRL